jgi:hypothetical protein
MGLILCIFPGDCSLSGGGMSAVYWRLGLPFSTERKQVRESRILTPSGLFNKAYSFYMAHNHMLNNEHCQVNILTL